MAAGVHRPASDDEPTATANMAREARIVDASALGVSTALIAAALGMTDDEVQSILNRRRRLVA